MRRARSSRPATVTASDPATGGFNFHSINPVVLSAGSGYTIGAFFQPSPGGPVGYDATGLVTIAQVTYTGGALEFGSSFQEPVGDPFGLNPGYFGPNFEVACYWAARG